MRCFGQLGGCRSPPSVCHIATLPVCLFADRRQSFSNIFASFRIISNSALSCVVCNLAFANWPLPRCGTLFFTARVSDGRQQLAQRGTQQHSPPHVAPRSPAYTPDGARPHPSRQSPVQPWPRTREGRKTGDVAGLPPCRPAAVVFEYFRIISDSFHQRVVWQLGVCRLAPS